MKEPLDYTRAAAMMDAAFEERKRYISLGCDPDKMGYGLWRSSLPSKGDGSIATSSQHSGDEMPLAQANRLGCGSIIAFVVSPFTGVAGWGIATLGVALWIAFLVIANKSNPRAAFGSRTYSQYLDCTIVGAILTVLYVVILAATFFGRH
ncbi:MAG TPA: hypothetical protein VGE59_03695 [Patescibacteria group bacterium]